MSDLQSILLIVFGFIAVAIRAFNFGDELKDWRALRRLNVSRDTMLYRIVLHYLVIDAVGFTASALVGLAGAFVVAMDDHVMARWFVVVASAGLAAMPLVSLWFRRPPMLGGHSEYEPWR